MIKRLYQQKTITGLLAALVLTAGVLFSNNAVAQDSSPVVSDLAVFKVIKDSKGKETFEDTASVKPGDVIEYRLKYTNKQNKAIVNLKPVLPVPEGTSYVDGSASPKPSAMAINGTFMPYPPVRKVKNAQGKTVNEPVPVEEFRSVQWTVGKVAAGASVNLKMRVSINKGS